MSFGGVTLLRSPPALKRLSPASLPLTIAIVLFSLLYSSENCRVATDRTRITVAVSIEDFSSTFCTLFLQRPALDFSHRAVQV